MERIKIALFHMLKGLSAAFARFPFTVISLALASSLVCYLISLNGKPPLNIEKLIFTFIVGAFIGVVAQFASEGFIKLSKARPLVYGVSLVLTGGYFAILFPAPEISSEIVVRSLVAIFAMVCAVLFIPAFRQRNDFNLISLIHFKGFFTSALFSMVLSGGVAAVIFAVDTLLVDISYNSYAYAMAIIWIFFAPIYYLSQLPVFVGDQIEKVYKNEPTEAYPKVLEILVSYISIPLFTAYTTVLIAYFVKILVTAKWPSGQLGPMVLVYSAAGLVLFVLAGPLNNHFAGFFKKVFPKVWVPIVIMQMVSVWIRINAYGITESRYYVALFGIFSIVSAVFLCIRPVSKNYYIALLAAVFAIISIIPPVDAFSVSRNSQIQRVEAILQAEGMLLNGELLPNSNASKESKKELTNILEYLNRQSTLEYISWLPDDFNIYSDMKKTFGFDPYYNYGGEERHYFYGNLNGELPIDISGYDTFVMINSYYEVGKKIEHNFDVGENAYVLSYERISRNDLRVSVKDKDGKELISTNLLKLAEPLADGGYGNKDYISPAEMTHVINNNGYGLGIVFQNISLENIGQKDYYGDYSAYVLFKTP